MKYILSFCVLIIIITLILFMYAPIHKPIIKLMLKNCTAPLKFTDDKGNILLEVGNETPGIDSPVAIINNEYEFWKSVVFNTDVGLGETFVNEVWKSPDITSFLRNLYFNFRDSSCDESVWIRGFSKLFGIKKIICKSSTKDKERIQSHYDIGNDFYNLYLKESALKAYTCGFFTSNECTLDESQKNKVDLIIKKMNVQSGQKILDIGCGWGHIANYISEKTGAHVVGLSISEEQIKYINSTFDSSKVSVIKEDWRYLIKPEYTEQFDCIYSIGMFEHVRYENYEEFFNVINCILKPEGRFVLHNIVSLVDTPKQMVENGTFITKHIFPGGQIPMHDWITNISIKIPGLLLSHSECFGGQHYAKTCREWRKLLLSEKDYVIDKYDNKLLNKFDYYLASCDAAFSLNLMALGHFVFVKTKAIEPLDFNLQYFP